MSIRLEGAVIVVPARGGSKRLPKKNVLDFDGKPLISWTVEQALESAICENVIVSSDDDEIIELANTYANAGVYAQKRPGDISTDSASSADVLNYVLMEQERQGFSYDTVILLQPTSPLRSVMDIVNTCATYLEHNKKLTAATVCRNEHPSAWCGTIDKSGVLRGVNFDLTRSQDHVDEYRLNGAVYVVPVENLKRSGRIFTDNVVAAKMPVERSVDIDTRDDFENALHKKRQIKDSIQNDSLQPIC